MNIILATIAAAQPVEHHSIWHNVIHSLPNDPASLFALALAVGVSVMVIVAGRSSQPKDRDEGGPRAA